MPQPTAVAAPRPGPARRLFRHWHRYRWVMPDPLRTPGLYACRCGVVRPGL